MGDVSNNVPDLQKFQAKTFPAQTLPADVIKHQHTKAKNIKGQGGVKRQDRSKLNQPGSHYFQKGGKVRNGMKEAASSTDIGQK
mmetsp:Transcript_30830/g.60160  ORF Transcript_30830/g.60160 Transcript_30830/m.60160 type:complete len:84 (+) Transcript_30830:122-373(+)